MASIFLVPHFAISATVHLIGFATFYATLLTSIAFYRLSPWHPLAKYPGPILAKLSKLWAIFMLSSERRRSTIIKLHKEPGPYVRIGKFFRIFNESYLSLTW